MKLATLLCAGFVALAALAPTTASAGHDSCSPRTRVTYDHCGRPIYWSYVQVGRDRCGRPVYQWVQTSRGGYGGGYNGYSGHHGSSGYGRGGYDPRRDRCDYGRSGTSFYWGR
jgi:hypothetical protein